jgi:Zn-dependent peptidase ImmA (M78 family)
LLKPHELAAWLLDELRVRWPDEIDVELLAQHCGATIIKRTLSGSDARIVGRGDRAIITVDEQAPFPRQRFSAAHELGHWLYDRERIAERALVAARCTDILGRKPGQRSAREVRADKFAADLLMPVSFFREATRSRSLGIGMVEDLARIFRTSFTATVRRVVDVEPRPSIFLEFKPDGERWYFWRHTELPDDLWPRRSLQRGTLASQLSPGDACLDGLVDASLWFDDPRVDGHEVMESSLLLRSGVIRTLLSWEGDEGMLLAL